MFCYCVVIVELNAKHHHLGTVASLYVTSMGLLHAKYLETFVKSDPLLLLMWRRKGHILHSWHRNHTTGRHSINIAMEASGSDGNSDDRARTVVIQLETEEELSTRSEQPMKSDNILKSLSPLIISMRALRLYFTINRSCMIPMPLAIWSHVVFSEDARRGMPKKISLYATVMLVMPWLRPTVKNWPFWISQG